MPKVYKSDAQFELFPDPPSPSRKQPKKAYVLKDLTLSVENIIVISIIFVMALVLFFSFGVERGKTVGLQRGQEESLSTGILEKEVAQEAVEGTAALPIAGEDVPVEDVQVRVADVFGEEEPQARTIESPAQTQKKVETPGEKKGFTVQVASFKKEKNALKEAEVLKKKGYDVFVLPKGDYFIVCVGQFDRKNEARMFSGRLKARYRDLLVRRF